MRDFIVILIAVQLRIGMRYDSVAWAARMRVNRGDPPGRAGI
jgi:hypothetical protein